MVEDDHIEEKEGVEELKSEQRDAEATTAWRKKCREVDGTSAV